MAYSVFEYEDVFHLESGESFPDLKIAYHTFGNLSSDSKIVWVCHNLTANSDPTDWWSGIFGEGKLFNPDEYFIICANIIGSPYGSTSPLSINTFNNCKWFRDFPLVSIRDMVRAHILLADYLSINNIDYLIGASIGGFQAIEWSIMDADRIKNLILIASSVRASPWLIASNTSQRLSIESDSSFYEDIETGGLIGLKAARSIALLTYRCSSKYNSSQLESDDSKLSDFKADSYQRYQGDKLVKRFNAYSYYCLTKTLDTHNISRNRNSFERVLSDINANSLIVGISSDILFPIEEQLFIAENINNAIYRQINTDSGHDGFLIEVECLRKIIKDFIDGK